MTNIKQDIKDVLSGEGFSSLEDKPKSYEDLDFEESGIEPVSLEEPEESEEKFKNSLWKRPAGELLLNTALDVPECLTKVSICLHESFIPKNKIYEEGINFVISFYTDIINSLQSNEPVGKVLKTINIIKNLEGANKLSRTVAELINAIKNPDKKEVTLRPYEKMKRELINLSIATNIINNKRLLTHGFDKFDNIYSLRDIFKHGVKLPGGIYANSYVGNLSTEVVLKPFFKANSSFAKYVSSFPWGKPKELVSEAVIVPGDRGTDNGFNDRFVLQVLIAYLINILTSDTVNPEEIFKLANEKAIKENVTGSLFDLGASTESMDAKLEMNPNDPDSAASKDVEATETGESEENLAAGIYNSDESDLIIDTKEAFNDLEDNIAYHDYIDKLKTSNSLTPSSILTQLRTTLRTEDDSDGLSAVLTETFATLPDKILGQSFECYAIKNNKVEILNILTVFKNLALGNTFISSLAETMSILYGITTKDIQNLIYKLPNSLEKAENSYQIGHNDTGYSILSQDPASIKVNKIYDTLKNSINSFNNISQSELSEVPSEALISTSEIQKALDINIEPKTIVSAGLTPKEIKIGQKAVRSGNLDQLWDSYVKDITDILCPTINIESWGLLKPTPLTATGDASAKMGMAFPTKDIPLGSKAKVGYGEKEITFLFASEGEYTAVASNILHAIESKKERFLQSKTLIEIIQVLSEILSSFGTVQGLKFFSSPDTQTCDPAKKCPLYKLLDPKYAITKPLQEVDILKTFALNKKFRVNSFLDLASNIIVVNNKPIQENILNKISKLLFEDKDNSYTRIACNIAINTQIRARILLALINLMSLVENILRLLHELVHGLVSILHELLGEGNNGPAEKLFKDLAKILVYIISTNPSGDELEDLFTGVVEGLNKKFKKYQQAKVTNLTDYDKIAAEMGSLDSFD